MPVPVRDRLGRPLHTLRVSVTDRCNLRCAYCMPEDDYVWSPRKAVLTFEEVDRVVAALMPLGLRRVRLTGGEPLLRRDLPELVATLRRRLGPTADLALTTNGTRLAGVAAELAVAGLSRITVSLDTLRRERFRALARRDALPAALAGIEAARSAGLPLKLDTVLLYGVNHDEVGELLDFARDLGAELRFIEYMDVGGATRWRLEDVVPRDRILAEVSGYAAETPRPLPGRGARPAERFLLERREQVFGIVPSVTAPFCRACDRARLTAEGTLFGCLYARRGLDLRPPLRSGATVEGLGVLVAGWWRGRSDRGAEERAALPQRGALAPSEVLRLEPWLEMHHRGG